jgi:ribA/ribD-fused uncharacterized protein
VYNCAEQFMMAQKARIFNDTETLIKIMAAKHPKEQKRLGRSVKNFDEATWNAIAEFIVFEGNMLKFSQNPELRTILIETEGTTLVEASPYDKIWGIGLSKDNPDIHDRTKWKGENKLGKVLTAVRIRLTSLPSE